MKYFGPKFRINLNQLSSNYDLIKSRIDNCDIMATVKANAYGHGAIQVAKTLEKKNVRYLAVFTLDEAIELRDAGIKTDIFIYSRLNIESLKIASKLNLTLNISSFDDLNFLKNNKFENLNVHIKFDTGMTRLGVSADRAKEFLFEISKIRNINIDGIYSHFSTADEGDLSYANNQLNLFNQIIVIANSLNIIPTFIHCSNSGAILNLPASRFNLVRVGMLLYGSYPSDEVPKDLNIKPVMSMTAPVVEIRNVKKGTQISYGGVYKTTKDTRIAVVQAGFADGVPRPWFEKGYVLFNNQKLKITGRICMDQLMIDVGEKSIQYGDEILIFGISEKHGEINLNEISLSINSTPYVLMTAVGQRPKRIYY